MFDHSGLWSLLTIVGPILLAAAMIYGTLSYKKRSFAAKQRTEAATKALYREGADDERQNESLPTRR